MASIDFSSTYKLNYVTKSNPVTGLDYEEWDGNTYAMRESFKAHGSKATFVTLPPNRKTWITSIGAAEADKILQRFRDTVCNVPASDAQKASIAKFIEQGYQVSGVTPDLDGLTAEAASGVITELRANQRITEMQLNAVDSSRDRKSA
jgi:hypothetical protein